jgi:hypothetical protein
MTRPALNGGKECPDLWISNEQANGNLHIIKYKSY